MKAPEIVSGIIISLTEAIPEIIGFAVELCDTIVSNLVGYDWSAGAEQFYNNFRDAFNNAMRGDGNYSDEAAQAQAERLRRYSSLTVQEIDRMTADANKKLEEYNSLIAARDGLSEQLQTSTSELFSESSEADKRTGEKDVTRKIDYAAFEKKLAAKKQLTSRIAELMEQNAPDSLIQELLKQDPEAALYYANELLKNPVKLGKLSASIEEDAAVSDIIANLMTENSEQFSALGMSAGELFGEGFTAAFNENFESAFKDVFDDEYTVSMRSAVAGAGNTAAVGTAVRQDTGRESSPENAVRRSVGTASGSTVYKIVDINGAYVAGVVNAENSRNNTISGG